jgi:hypothetical protein
MVSMANKFLPKLIRENPSGNSFSINAGKQGVE